MAFLQPDICPNCGAAFYSGVPGPWQFCPSCEKPWPKKEIKNGGQTQMPKKLYGAAAKAHAKKTGRKAPATKKATKKATGGGVMHKAYSYTNKAGKRITVAAHVEHPKKK